MSDGYSSDDSDDSELNKATGIETSMGDSTIRQRGSYVLHLLAVFPDLR